MELKRTTADMEFKMKAENEQKHLELEKQFGAPIARHTRTMKLPKLELQTFHGNILKWQVFWDSFEASIHKNPNLLPVDKFNYLRAELEGDASVVISGSTKTRNPEFGNGNGITETESNINDRKLKNFTWHNLVQSKENLF